MAEPYLALERALSPLADPPPPPRPGDWLAEHDEPGQTFAEYLDARPVRRGDTLSAIYLCLVGEFSGPAHGSPAGPGGSNGTDQGRDPDKAEQRVALPDRVVPVQRRVGGYRGASGPGGGGRP